MLYQTKHYAVMGIHINYIAQYQLNSQDTKEAQYNSLLQRFKQEFFKDYLVMVKF